MKKEKPYNPTVAWNRERKKLKIIFEQKGITSCEIKMSGCWRNSALGFAHLHKRIWYFKKENRDLLGDFNQVLLACNICHMAIEGRKGATEEIFKRLRK